MLIATEQHQQLSPFNKINENDPKQLRSIIQTLIQKSKTLIVNLEQTLLKLQQMQKQRDFWKNQYFNFRDACMQYTQNKVLPQYEHISFLQHKIKSIEIQNICLSEKFTETMNRNNKNIRSIDHFQSTQKKKQQKYNKSTSNVSYSKDSPYQQRKHKKIELFKTQSRKNSSSFNGFKL